MVLALSSSAQCSLIPQGAQKRARSSPGVGTGTIPKRPRTNPWCPRDSPASSSSQGGCSKESTEDSALLIRIHEELGGGDVTESAPPSNTGIQVELEMHQPISLDGIESGGRNRSRAAPFIQINAHQGAGSLSVEEEAETQQNQALKFAYCSMSVSAAGVLAAVVALNQIGKGDITAFKIFTALLISAFTFAACIAGLAGFGGRISYRTKILNTLVYMSLGSLVIGILGISFIFLKLLTLIATAPILFLLAIWLKDLTN